MFKIISQDRWAPFYVGAGIGLLSILSFALLHKLLGASAVFVHVNALVWYFVRPEHLSENAYYTKMLNDSTLIDWQMALIVGVFIGSYFSGNFFQKSPVVHVPLLWKERFGPSKIKRYFGAFLGGLVLLFGARLAGGCASGNGISGSMQLAVSGWLFLLGLFALGVPTAWLLYQKKK